MKLNQYLFGLLLALGLTANIGYSKIEVIQTSCDYDEGVGFDVCKKDDKSKLIKKASENASNSYKLEEMRGSKENLCIDDNNEVWSIVDAIKKIDQLKEKDSNLSEFKFGTNVAGGVLTFDTEINSIIVAFHGTQNSEDIITDLKFLSKELNTIGMTKGYVHSGFIDRYLRDRAAMFLELQNLIEKLPKNSDKPYNIVVTGHSLGGALATIAAFDIKKNLLKELGMNKTKVELVTFNSPRVFDKEAASEFEKLLGDHAYRLWREYDPVSAVPTGRQGFKHVGKSLKLPSVSWVWPHQNHSLKHTLQEVSSPYTTRPSEKHQGWF